MRFVQGQVKASILVRLARRRLSDLCKSEEDVLWYATDSVGNLAAFASNGVASVPIAATKESNSYALDELDEYVGSQQNDIQPSFGPNLTEYQRQYPNPRNSLIVLAGKGVYVFDGVSEFRYRILYKPAQPLGLRVLPEIHRQTLNNFIIDTNFSLSDSLTLSAS